MYIYICMYVNIYIYISPIYIYIYVCVFVSSCCSGKQQIHSDSLTWKWKIPCSSRKVVFQRNMFHFHVSESECTVAMPCQDYFLLGSFEVCGPLQACNSPWQARLQPAARCSRLRFRRRKNRWVPQKDLGQIGLHSSNLK